MTQAQSTGSCSAVLRTASLIGKQQARRTAKTFKERDLMFDKIICSPLMSHSGDVKIWTLNHKRYTSSKIIWERSRLQNGYAPYPANIEHGYLPGLIGLKLEIWEIVNLLAKGKIDMI